MGGGAPLSGVAGRREILMQMYDGVAFGGSFNGNPVSLASAHATAAAAVAQLDAGPASSQNSALADALRSVASAYTALSRAAARHDAAGYKAATAAVSSAEQALSTAFAALEKLGYRVG